VSSAVVVGVRGSVIALYLVDVPIWRFSRNRDSLTRPSRAGHNAARAGQPAAWRRAGGAAALPALPSSQWLSRWDAGGKSLSQQVGWDFVEAQPDSGHQADTAQSAWSSVASCHAQGPGR
jgi:hypothetical protein